MSERREWKRVKQFAYIRVSTAEQAERALSLPGPAARHRRLRLEATCLPIVSTQPLRSGTSLASAIPA